MNTEEAICPFCNGSGKIKKSIPSSELIMSNKIEIANHLKKNGFTVLDIMKIMNYRSTSAVAYLLKK